jgi:hypothetical protein
LAKMFKIAKFLAKIVLITLTPGSRSTSRLIHTPGPSNSVPSWTTRSTCSGRSSRTSSHPARLIDFYGKTARHRFFNHCPKYTCAIKCLSQSLLERHT